jgi:hypothetical protein
MHLVPIAIPRSSPFGSCFKSPLALAGYLVIRPSASCTYAARRCIGRCAVGLRGTCVPHEKLAVPHISLRSNASHIHTPNRFPLLLFVSRNYGRSKARLQPGHDDRPWRNLHDHTHGFRWFACMGEASGLAPVGFGRLSVFFSFGEQFPPFSSDKTLTLSRLLLFLALYFKSLVRYHLLLYTQLRLMQPQSCRTREFGAAPKCR